MKRLWCGDDYAHGPHAWVERWLGVGAPLPSEHACPGVVILMSKELNDASTRPTRSHRSARAAENPDER